MVKQHPKLGRLINRIKNPALYEDVPSRLLFTGPSGFGKTYIAKALAKYCEVDCVYVEGSEVGNTHRNSGAKFINSLFKGLFERPERSFMVIIDEILPVIEFIDPRYDQTGQNATASAFCSALDDCARKRNVCVIGTGIINPERLSDRIKTRFAHKIFTFNQLPLNDLVDLTKEWLSYNHLSDEHVNAYRDEFLMPLVQSVQHRSIRELETLIEKSKMLAVVESQNPKATVTEEHLTRIFEMHRDPTWLEKVWADRDKHLQNLVSARAIPLYMLVGGIGLIAYDSPQKNYGKVLATLGLHMNYWLKNKRDDTELLEILVLTHLLLDE